MGKGREGKKTRKRTSLSSIILPRKPYGHNSYFTFENKYKNGYVVYKIRRKRIFLSNLYSIVLCSTSPHIQQTIVVVVFRPRRRAPGYKTKFTKLIIKFSTRKITNFCFEYNRRNFRSARVIF